MAMESKICLSIGNVEFEEVLQQLRKVDLAEIRMDLLGFTDEQFKTIFQSHRNLIATFRSPEGDFLTMSMMLAKAIDYGCAFVDIDIANPDSFRNALVLTAKRRGVNVILSYHNFTETPSADQLNRIIEGLFSNGAQIAKIACMANSSADCSRMLGLYENNKNIVAFCMGEIGRITRLAAPLLGAPFTYASIKGKETAPGQMAFEEVEKFFNNI
jgi:3-dehydroquinate dehydratase-1